MLIPKEVLRDLGRLPQKKKANFSLEIMNEGDTPIEVEKITVGCGSCTVASMNTKIVRPRGSEYIQVAFTPATTGTHKKYINVRYAKDQVLRLEFIAEVYEES